jgi:hypothetical protein
MMTKSLWKITDAAWILPQPSAASRTQVKTEKKTAKRPQIPNDFESLSKGVRPLD